MDFYTDKNFWKEGLEPVAEIAINKAEQELSVTLPKSYLDLLREHNGGELEYPYFFIKDEKERTAMHSMNGIDPEGFSVLSSPSVINKLGLPDNLILLNGDYHSWIALDYRNNDIPSVAYFYEDYSEEEMQWGSIEIAPSFDIFLSKLFRGSTLDRKKLKPSYGRSKPNM
ncbi:SMI1/KNR4 family protein [Domibacillus sp. PGB-M46]|uniref:SMI1/KNR4 family protein n=1 Tax=Domibacillus sp. PGB-M46 TaxID=2910255 RepID=UPI001F58AB6A|nr:SMI1/KNR4 family protein [Domibacillus sp. PGB-M46]MCI2256201.1 SMI1/KNR4 family protein [Domibacillus sp. PGB-M46]